MTPDVVNASIVPSLPPTLAIKDPAVKRFLDSLKQINLVREGEGDPLDGFVTFRDLMQSGIGNIVLSDGKRAYAQNGTQGFLEAPGVPTGTLDYTAPPAVTTLAATAALNSVIVTFDLPTYYNHAYTEIWRASTNSLGSAVKIGAVPVGGSVYADAVGSTNTPRYYWARNVSNSNIVGPYNATSGTLATTGLILGTDVAVGTLTGDKIAAATITGSNIVAATITGSLIAASTITASNLSVTQLSAISANIGTATAGKIQNSGGTNYVDLNATGVSTFIAAGTAFKVDASGNVSIASGTTGARLTIANNVIKVYDSLGTLRVQIGDLTA